MSVKTNNIDIYLGTTPIGFASDPTTRYTTPDAVRSYINAFAARGYNRLDAARLYPSGAMGSTEVLLGEVGATHDFVIDSKYFSFNEGALKKDAMEKSLGETLRDLKADSVHTMYLHMPEPHSPLEETLAAAHEAYKAGKFKYFGLSNYSAEEIEKIIDLCDANGWIKPTVYQGLYNVIKRDAEALFPVLRKHGMQFVAWSPAAGGFFSGLEYGRPGSKFETVTPQGQMYNSLYKPSLQQPAADLVAKAKAEGMTGHAAALRWIIHHSKLQSGDAVITAGSSVKQLNENLDALEAGPLPDSLVQAFEEVWETSKKE